MEEGRVILHEAYFTDKFIENGEMKSFEKTSLYKEGYINRQNEMLVFCYTTLKNACANKMKVIDFKDTDLHIGDSEHKWGKSGVHYIKAYYAQLFDEIDRLTQLKDS